MPPRYGFMPKETQQFSNELDFNDRTSRDLWALSFQLNSEADIDNLSSLVDTPTQPQQRQSSADPYGGMSQPRNLPMSGTPLPDLTSLPTGRSPAHVAEEADIEARNAVRMAPASGTPVAMPQITAAGGSSSAPFTLGTAPSAVPPIAGSNPEVQAAIYRQARASGLDDEGAKVLVAVSETEGGTRGAVGDNGQAHGVYQFHAKGELPGFTAWARANNLQGDPTQLAVDPTIATRYAAEGYLGQAIARGRQLGLTGSRLATYVQQTGQRSVAPGITGQNYERLFGSGAPPQQDYGDQAGQPGMSTVPVSSTRQTPSVPLDTRGITQAYKGVPYTFGGPGGRSDPRLGVATDCSGFVASVYKDRFGLDLAAHTDTSYNQLKQLGATEVSQQDARPGDVVYYMGAGTGGNITHHMGIFAGPGRVLDMSVASGGGVQERDIGHAGRFVILRDPRVNTETPRTASAPPPIVPSADSGGVRVGPAEADHLAQAAAGPTAAGSSQAPVAALSPSATTGAIWSPDVGTSAPSVTQAPTGRGGGGGGVMNLLRTDPLAQAITAAGGTPDPTLPGPLTSEPRPLPYDAREDDQGPHEWRPEYGQYGYPADDAARTPGQPAIGSWPGDEANPSGAVGRGPIYGTSPLAPPMLVDPEGLPRFPMPQPAPAPAQPLARGQPGTMYRQPLVPTLGPDTTPGAPYDPRDADQGPHELTPPAAPLTSTYNDPTAGGTLQQPVVAAPTVYDPTVSDPNYLQPSGRVYDPNDPSTGVNPLAPGALRPTDLPPGSQGARPWLPGMAPPERFTGENAVVDATVPRAAQTGPVYDQAPAPTRWSPEFQAAPYQEAAPYQDEQRAPAPRPPGAPPRVVSPYRPGAGNALAGVETPPSDQEILQGQGLVARGIDAAATANGAGSSRGPLIQPSAEDRAAFMTGRAATVSGLVDWHDRMTVGAADALSRGLGQDPDHVVASVTIGGVPIRMTVSDLLQNVTDPAFGAGFSVGDIVLDAVGKRALHIVAPYVKGAARAVVDRFVGEGRTLGAVAEAGVGRIRGALDANAERVAAADARIAEQGSTATHGTLGVVPPGGSEPPVPSQPARTELVLPPKQLTQISKDIAETHAAGGGATFSPERGNLAGQPLYSVSLYPERSAKNTLAPTPKDVESYIKKNRDLLADDRLSVGTWFNERTKDNPTGDNLHYLDIVATLPDRALAERMGSHYNQFGIYGLGGDGYILTGGTGTAPRVLPPERTRLPLQGENIAAMRARLAEQARGAAEGRSPEWWQREYGAPEAIGGQPRAMTEAEMTARPLEQLLMQSAASSPDKLAHVSGEELRPLMQFRSPTLRAAGAGIGTPLGTDDTRKLMQFGLDQGWGDWYRIFGRHLAAIAPGISPEEGRTLFSHFSSQLSPAQALDATAGMAMAARDTHNFQGMTDKQILAAFQGTMRNAQIPVPSVSANDLKGAQKLYEQGFKVQSDDSWKTATFQGGLTQGQHPARVDIGYTGDVQAQRVHGYQAFHPPIEEVRANQAARAPYEQQAAQRATDLPNELKAAGFTEQGIRPGDKKLGIEGLTKAAQKPYLEQAPTLIDWQNRTMADEGAWQYMGGVGRHIANEVGVPPSDGQAALWVVGQRGVVPLNSSVLSDFRTLNPKAPIFVEEAQARAAGEEAARAAGVKAKAKIEKAGTEAANNAPMLATWTRAAEAIKDGTGNIGTAFEDLQRIGVFDLEDPASLGRILQTPNQVNAAEAWRAGGYAQKPYPGAAQMAEGLRYESHQTRPWMRAGADEGRLNPLHARAWEETPSIVTSSGRFAADETRHVPDLNVPHAVVDVGDTPGSAIALPSLGSRNADGVARMFAEQGQQPVTMRRATMPGETGNSVQFTLDSVAAPGLQDAQEAIRQFGAELGGEVHWDGRQIRMYFDDLSPDAAEQTVLRLHSGLQSEGINADALKVGTSYVERYDGSGAGAGGGAQAGIAAGRPHPRHADLAERILAAIRPDESGAARGRGGPGLLPGRSLGEHAGVAQASSGNGAGAGSPTLATVGFSPGLGSRLAADIGSSASTGVMGAAIGAGAPADTPEERRRNALIGAGVGMVGGPLSSEAIRLGRSAMARRASRGVAAAPPPVAGDWGMHRLLPAEASATIDFLARTYGPLNVEGLTTAISGRSRDEAADVLHRAWLSRGGTGDAHARETFVNDVRGALQAAERDVRGRAFDPRMERAGYGRRYNPDDVDTSPATEAASANIRYGNDFPEDVYDPASPGPEPLPRTRDVAGRSISLNATLGPNPGAPPPRESPLNPVTGYRRTAPVDDLTQSADPQTRRFARMMEGQYHGPSIPENRSIVQRIGDAYVRAMTDDRNMTDNFARAAADSAGVPPASVRGMQETLTQLTRVNGASVANQRLNEGFRKGLSIVADDQPAEQALPIYLTHRHNIDVAVEAGEKAKREILDAPEPSSITSARAAADRAHAAGDTATADRLDRRVSQWEQGREGKAQAAADRVMEGRDFSGDLDLNDTQQALIRLQEQITPEQWQKVTQAADEIYRFNQETLDRQVQAGRVPAELAAHLKERYPHYVRTDIADYFEGGPSGPAPSGRVMGISDIGIKKISMEGTTKDRVNPLLSTIDATHAAEAAIQRNVAGQEFVRLRDEAPEWQGIFKEVGWEDEAASQGAATSAAGSQRALRGAQGPLGVPEGAEPAGAAVARQADTYPRTAEPTGTGLAVPGQGRSGSIPAPPDPTRVPPDYKLRNGEQFLTVFEDGKPRTFVIPKEYAPIVTPKVAPLLADSGGANAFRWWMNTYKSLLTSRKPGFAHVVSPIRDAWDATTREMTLSAQHGGLRGAGESIASIPSIMKDYLQAIPNSFEGFTTGTYKGDLAEMMKAGAGQMGRPARDEKQLRAALDDLKRPNVFVLKDAGDARRFAMNVLTLGANPIGERLEQIPRLMAARRAAARGETGLQQAMRFRDATVDFQRGGWASRVANQVIPFFNVATQGPAQLARTAKANPAAFTAAVATSVGLPVLAAEAWNHADEQRARDYEDVPQYLKDSGVVFMLPFMEGTDERGDRRPGYAWLPLGNFASLAVPMREAAATAMGSDTRLSDPNRWGELALAMGMMYSPVRGDSAGAAVSSLMPIPGTSTVAELAANKDLYRGSTIATDRADERATPISRAVASGINTVTGGEVRPSQVEYAARDVGGTLADTILGASDLVAGRTKQEDRPVANTPIVGGTVGRIIRDTGGQRLTNAQDEDRRLPASIRPVLAEAGLRRDQIQPVSSRFEQIPLTRAEQTDLQERTNGYIEREVDRVQRSPEWRRSPTTQDQQVRDAIKRAQERAGAEVLRGIPLTERLQRIRADRERQAS